MPKEYQVKINVDASAAEKKILQFEQKAQRTFDKLNKTSFKPEAFINGINVSITKVMELAAKSDAAAAKVAQANAKVEQAQQKTAQVAIAANAKIEAEQAKASAAAVKAAAQQQAAAEKTAQATINANAKITQSNNKLTSDQVRESTKRQQAYLRSADVAQKAQAQMVQSAEKSVQAQINSNTKLTLKRMEGEQKQKEADQQRQQSSQNTSNTVVTENEKMGASYEKLASTATSAWNQIKMVIGYAGAASMFRSALTEMKAMSVELVTYQKVTGATAEQMKQVRASAYQSAKQYGQSPSDYLSSVAMMARAGYGQQAEAMANLATKTQLVGDMSAEMASKFLIAVDAGYQMKGNIEELEKVLNAANVADNNYATSLAEIAEGMTLIAPLAAGMNVSVNEAMAAIGTMQALTQRSGTEVARAFRMIAINIAKDTETEVEEGFKLTQENIEDFNALLQEFAKEELAAAEASGKLLSPMKAIEAIAKAWKSGKLNEQQLFSVLNNIGGARYTNNIMALVKNFDVYQEMLGKFSTEMTSANDEVAAMMDSWSAKLEVLKTSWVEMVNNRVSEGFIKDLLDMGTGFLQWTGNLENFIGVVGSAVKAVSALSAGLRGLSSGQGFGALNGWTLAISALVAAFSAAKSAYESYKKSALDTSNGAVEQSKKTYEQAKRTQELIARYRELSADGVIDSTELGEVEQIQQEINSLVGELPGKYDLVTGSIEKSKEALAKMSAEQRKSTMISSREAVNTTGKAMVDYGSTLGVFTGLNAEFTSNRNNQSAIKSFLSGVLSDDSMFRFVGGGAGEDDALVYAGKRTAEEILKGYDELSEIIDKATEQGLEKTASNLYYALIEARDNMTEVVENYRQAVEYKDLIWAGDFSGEGGSSSGGSGAGSEGTTSNVKGATTAVDAYAASFNRLQAAIDAATTAQSTFNDETSKSKGDQLKFYGSALEAYNEELKAGRVNSNAFHAAAKALMGEDAYAATGGYTQNVQAAMNAKGSSGISLIDAITTLTAEYKNQKDQVVEGAGLAVLLEKLGYNVKDEKGNYAVRMTEEMYKEVMAAIPGLTREMLENAANAYDQHDIYGRNTNISPDEAKAAKTPEVESTDANTESVNANTEAVNELTAAIAESNKDAKEGKETGGGKASPEDAIKAGQARQTHTTASLKDVYAGMAGGGSHVNVNGAWGQMGAALFKNTTVASVEGNVATMSNGQKVIAVSKLPVKANRALANAKEQRPETMLVDISGTAGSRGIVKPGESMAKAADEKAAQEKRDANIEEISDELKNQISVSLSAIEKREESNAKAKIMAEMQPHLMAGDFLGAFGGDEVLAGRYMNALRTGKTDEATAMLQAYVDAQDVSVAGNVDWANDEKSFNDIVVGIKPILDKYSANTVAEALQYLTEEEREAVIAAMLETYTLEEVIASLDSATEQDRVAILTAAIDKHGAEKVAEFIAALPPEKRATYLKSLLDAGATTAATQLFAALPPETRATTVKSLLAQGATEAAAKLIASLPPKEQATLLKALLDDETYKDTAAKLALLTDAETKTIYVETLTVSGSNGANGGGKGYASASGSKQLDTSENHAVYAVGTKNFRGGTAYVNDGTGAELIVDSTGAHIVGGGRPTLTNVEKGARIYTAEQTRQLIGSVPHYAVGSGSLSSRNNALADSGSGVVLSSDVLNAVNDLRAYFDNITTGDTSYSRSDGKSGGGSGKSGSGNSGSGGGSGSGNDEKDERWDELQTLIEYILKRMNKALDKQLEIIDKQIEELENRRSQSEQQNRLEELQKAVTDAQADLLEAQSNRTVRYLNDQGQWEWMADAGKVQKARESLSDAQKELQDYLNDLVIDAQIKALEDEKERLSSEYQEYADLWSDILDAVDTPKGDLVELIKSLTESGTGAQKNGVAAVRDLLITAMKGGSYKKNYTEAVGEIAKAAADNPSVPGVPDEALAALIASSRTNISPGAMYEALTSLAGGGTLAGGRGSDTTNNNNGTYYYINGVQIGADMAELPMSDVLRRLSVFNNTIA